MERKPKRRTPERILETALRLFNEFGEPGVTTAAIADETGISPGNLYYHFRSKDEIVESLFNSFYAEIDKCLVVPDMRATHVEDIWLFLHLLFEAIWKYRFLYRDINDLISRNRMLEMRIREVMARKAKTAAAICEGLAAAGAMRATRGEIQTLAVNMTVIATYWLSFEFVRNPRVALGPEALARGAFQVMSLAAPFLTTDSRELFDQLARDYIS